MVRATRTVTVELLPDAPAARLPSRATVGSGCFDLAAATAVELERGKVELVRTGLKVRCPRGTFLEVRPRSGLASRGVLMVNAPGTIDHDYSGEVRVPLTYLFEGRYRVEAGDRIAQMIVARYEAVEWAESELTESRRGAGGFGSSGR